MSALVCMIDSSDLSRICKCLFAVERQRAEVQPSRSFRAGMTLVVSQRLVEMNEKTRRIDERTERKEKIGFRQIDQASGNLGISLDHTLLPHLTIAYKLSPSHHSHTIVCALSPLPISII